MENSKERKASLKGGRPKLPADIALNHRINWKLSKREYDELQLRFKASGLSTLTEYLKTRLIATDRLYIHNPADIFKSLELIGVEVGQIGKNINQLAKYANTLNRQQKIDPGVIVDLNNLLTEYSIHRKQLTLALRALMKK